MANTNSPAIYTPSSTAAQSLDESKEELEDTATTMVTFIMQTGLPVQQRPRRVQMSSVQLKVVSMHSEKPIIIL